MVLNPRSLRMACQSYYAK